jgi:hypothetical protein
MRIGKGESCFRKSRKGMEVPLYKKKRGRKRKDDSEKVNGTRREKE